MTTSVTVSPQPLRIPEIDYRVDRAVAVISFAKPTRQQLLARRPAASSCGTSRVPLLHVARQAVPVRGRGSEDRRWLVRLPRGSAPPGPIARGRGAHPLARAEIGVSPRQIEDSEIVDRLVYALVNEGARILEEGIAARASDIDVVYLTGYGFPLARGGPMFYAD